METFARRVRGLPIWLLREYLEEAGGESDKDGVITGPGWTAQVTQMDDFQIGSLCVGQVWLEVEGETEAMAGLMEILNVKLARAGG